MTTISTRKTTISARRVNGDLDGTYCASWIGLKAIFTNWEGERLVGTITHWKHGYPCVTFPDGTWARLTHQVEIVNG